MLRSLLQDGFSSLQQLELWHALLLGPETMKLFNQLVNLDTICVVDCGPKPPFFDALNTHSNMLATKITVVHRADLDLTHPTHDLTISDQKSKWH